MVKTTPEIFESARTTKRINSLRWIFDAFESDAGYVRSRMFGCETAYIDGHLCLAIADKDEPWNGLLVCTAHQHHASLIQEMPALQVHEVLGKWLYVSQSNAAFEDVVEQITELVLARDPRIGIAPKRK